ncbi:MAG: DUF2442 domain-containing protein [Elusimicrobia bacterium]|nr:DUF2442 domain-containing protein [Elusimicrobiota bacterium]
MPVIKHARYLGGHKFQLGFSTGESGVVDLAGYRARGGVFERFNDLSYVREGSVDPEWETLCWPGGVDIAPEALYRLACPYVQDKNAGNLGDLLKHYWLLRIVERVLETQKPQRVAYLESHAGAGLFQLDGARVSRLEKERSAVCPSVEAWGLFDRLNPGIENGEYLGSFALALRLLAEYSRSARGATVRGVLYENHPEAIARIEAHWQRLFPLGMVVDMRKAASSADSFLKGIRACVEDGFSVFWLCDPFWGKSKDDDMRWWRLLEDVPQTYGILFAYVGGDSTKTGMGKLDFQKTIHAPCQPWRQAPDNIRAYGLYCTHAVCRLFDQI